MPHFVIHCSENVTHLVPKMELMKKVYDTADETGLFSPGDIKVRIDAFSEYIVGGGQKDFVHVFGNIMEGRTDEQKSHLSHQIVSMLKSILPQVPILSMNVRNFDKASYCNKEMI